MPGNVANAAAITELPPALAAAFSRSEEYPVLRNEYPSGDSQRELLGDTSRPRWRLTRRLTAAAMTALRQFYEARGGPHEPFQFTDEDGIARVVRFAGEFSQVFRLGRGEVSFELIELA